MYQIKNRPDTASMLSTLAGMLRELNVPVDQFLRQNNQQLLTNQVGGYAPAAYTRISGPVPKDKFRDLVSNSSIIEFADWASIQDGTRLWDELYRDVIKPLNKRDFHFLFHLGNVANKNVYDTDEVLDIIGDYSAYGKVTLLLDKDEAGNLWGKLNGSSLDERSPAQGTIPSDGLTGFEPGPPSIPVGSRPDSAIGRVGYETLRAGEKYRFILNTMTIDSLVVRHGYSALQLSRDGKFVLPGMPPFGNNKTMNHKTSFGTGYLMGLLLHLGIWHCLALGLAVSGVEAENSSGPDISQLITYINDWISLISAAKTFK